MYRNFEHLPTSKFRIPKKYFVLFGNNSLVLVNSVLKIFRFSYLFIFFIIFVGNGIIFYNERKLA